MSHDIYTDTKLLDFLESLNAKQTYTGRCICRQSRMGRGWRLHETEMAEAHDTVREAIADAIERPILGILKDHT